MPDPKKQPQKYKRWVINLVILVLVTLLMIALSEVAFRWIDGYQFSTIELNQDPDSIQPTE